MFVAVAVFDVAIVVPLSICVFLHDTIFENQWPSDHRHRHRPHPFSTSPLRSRRLMSMSKAWPVEDVPDPSCSFSLSFSLSVQCEP